MLTYLEKCLKKLVKENNMGINQESTLINEFIEWARNCGEDAFYIFDKTDEAIQKFLDQK